MDWIARLLRRRIEKLERELAAIPPPVSPEEMARREARTTELSAAAAAGREPEDLGQEEREYFARLLLYAPVYLELLEEGALGHHGESRRRDLCGDDPGASREELNDEDPHCDGVEGGY